MMTSNGQLRLDFAPAPDAAVPPVQSPTTGPAPQPVDAQAGEPDGSPQPVVARREFALKGLDGGNLLGFLAAVGALQSVTAMEPAANWRMWWQQDSGPWRPTLSGNTALEPAELPQRLADYLRDTDNDALKVSKDLTISTDEFRKIAKTAQGKATCSDRRFADFITSFGCENTPPRDKKGNIQFTALQTIAGSGRQYFLDTMLRTVQQTDSEHLRRSLFEPWERKDRRLGLRWDPAEERRYALRWKEPSSEPARTERGANRLAIEALPLLPTAISGARLETTGFRQELRRGIYFSWPIWICPLSIATIASVMRLEELRRNEPRHERLTPLGIAAVYRSRRVTEGKQRNFTPAIPV